MSLLKDKMKSIATLGPEGTCSEVAARCYIEQNNLHGYKLNLYSSFELAIDTLLKSNANLVVIPSAYSSLSEILFSNYYKIEIIDAFMLKTPDLVIATTRKDKLPRKLSISSHSSPAWLVKNHYPEAKIIRAKSNSDAAQLVLQDKSDACLTTIICAEKNSLNVLHNYKGINMSWNVIKKTKEL